MRPRYSLRFRLDAPLVGDQSVRSWVHLARTGPFKGHSQGAFELTKEIFEAFIANRPTNPIPFYYEHPDHVGRGTPIPAAGWVHELKTDGKNLFGLVEWTPRAVGMIRDGEYKYCSIVFSTESIDRETGEEVGPEMYEVGLTNVPYIDSLKPIMCTRPRGDRRKLAMQIDKKKLIEALAELPDDASPEQYHLGLEAALLAQEAMEAPKEEKEKPMEPEMTATPAPATELSLATAIPADTVSAATPVPNGDPAAAAKDELAGLLEQATGLDIAGVVAWVKENLEALGSLAKASPDSGTPAEDKAMAMSRVMARAEVAEAKLATAAKRLAELETLATAAAQKQIDVLVDDAIRCGHILPTHRDTFIKLGRHNRGDLEAELGRYSKAPAVPTGRLVKSAPAESTTDLNPSDNTEKEILRMLSRASDSTKKSALEKYRARKPDHGRA